MCNLLYKTTVTLLLLSLFSCNDQESGARSEIERILQESVAGWNRGSLEDFMEAYEQSDSLCFISGGSVTYGWQTVYDRYKQHYAGPDQMGQLRFSDISIQLTCSDLGVVHGIWELERADDRPHGRFTLIIKNTDGGWRIIHDHTSSAD